MSRYIHRIFHLLPVVLVMSTVGTNAYAQTKVVSKDTTWNKIQNDLLPQNQYKLQYMDAYSVLRQTDSLGEYTRVYSAFVNNKATVFDPQKGDGLKGFQLGSSSFRRLGGKQSIWGKVYYQNATHTRVTWNENADIDRIAPYVIADSVGGDMKEEGYYLSGGYNRVFGKTVVGIGGVYKAANSFRRVDPRPKNTTSDLALSAAVAYPISNYYVALAYRYTYYFQNTSVSISNPLHNPIFYHLNGMGMDNNLLRGNKKETSHVFTENTLSLLLHPSSGKGLYFSGAYAHKYVDKSITSLLSLLVSDAKTNLIDFNLGYQWLKGNTLFKTALTYAREKKRGTSYLFDNQTSSNYIKIGEVQDYNNDESSVHFDLTYGRFFDAPYYLALTPSFRYNRFEMSYKGDQRTMDVPTLETGATATLGRFAKKGVNFTLDLGYIQRWNNSPTLQLSDALYSRGLDDMVRQQFEAWSAANSSYVLDAKSYFRLTDTYNGFVDVSYRLSRFSEDRNNHTAEIRFGVLF